MGIVVVLLRRGQLKWRTIGKAALVLMIAAAIFFPQLEGQLANNFGSSHFKEEVTSRVQLNDVAEEMFANNPIIGVGLNNFQDAMGPYEDHGVIFIDNPVQSLYLLYLSETGILGTIGFLLIGFSMFGMAFRLAKSRDRFFCGIGLGVSAAMVFLVIEELLDFALREDVPLDVYWIFAGLVVACCQMAGLEGRTRTHAIRPSGPPHAARAALDVAVASRSLPRSVPASAARQLQRAARKSRQTARNHGHRATSPSRAHHGRHGRSRTVPQTGESRRRLHIPSHIGGVGRVVIIAPLAVVLAVGTTTSASAARLRALAATSPAISQMRIVFAGESTAVNGAPGISGIFEANGDGTGLTRLSPGNPRERHRLLLATVGARRHQDHLHRSQRPTDEQHRSIRKLREHLGDEPERIRPTATHRLRLPSSTTESLGERAIGDL